MYKKGCLQLIQFFLWIRPFSNLLRKTNFPSISELSERVIFWLKREVFSKFHRKRFKITENHTIAVCGSFWGEKQFLLILVHFYWFDQIQLFKQVLIFLRIFPFPNVIRKTNFLSISVLLSDIVNFLTKKGSFQWISPKMLQNNREAYYSCMYFSLRKKQFLLIFVPFYCFEQKRLLTKKSEFSSGFFPFQTWWENQTF